MPDIGAMKELLGRVEGATGADWWIDGEIYIALFVPHEQAGRIDHDRGVAGWWPKDGPYESSIRTAPYTSSIDACVALIEKVLPGWWVACGLCTLSGHASIGPDYNAAGAMARHARRLTLPARAISGPLRPLRRGVQERTPRTMTATTPTAVPDPVCKGYYHPLFQR